MEEAAGSSEIHKLGLLRGPSSALQTNMFCWAGTMIFKNLSVNALGQEYTSLCPVVFTTPYCHTSNSFLLHFVPHTAGFCSQLCLSSVLYVKSLVRKDLSFSSTLTSHLKFFFQSPTFTSLLSIYSSFECI